MKSELNNNTPVRTFFHDLFGTYGWVVVLIVGVIGSFFLQVKDLSERISKVEVRVERLDEKIDESTKLLSDKLDAIAKKQDEAIDILSKKQDDILTYLRKGVP